MRTPRNPFKPRAPWGRRRGVPPVALAGAAVLGFAGAYGILAPDRPATQGFDTSPTQFVEQRAAVSSGSCDIKGNISASGERIYHLPGQDYYGRTRIDTGKGERYFCSEAEARAAGWRRSKV